MTSAEHLAHDFGLQSRGIHVLSWDDKTDLVRALSILRAALPTFSDSLTVMPTAQAELQQFGLCLFEGPFPSPDGAMRLLLVPQASVEVIGAWLNGWRRRLADPPGTLIVIRHSDLMPLYRRAPDLMSFAQSEVYEATGLLPLVTRQLCDRVRAQVPEGWKQPLDSLPGAMPSETELSNWLETLRSNVD
jgi:hypothetical protein